MAQITTDPSGNEIAVLPDGRTVGLGLRPADMGVMRAQPQYVSTLQTIPRSQWPKKGGGLRRFFRYSWDQGQQGSCGGHGGAAAFTAAWNYQGQTDHEFSPTYLYGLVNGGQDRGSTPEDLKTALETTGICLRSTVGPGEIFARSFPPTANGEAANYRADNQLVFTTFDELATAIIREQAVFTGIFCGGRFTPDANGLLPDWDGRQVGGHCTAQIGELEYIPGRGWGAWTKNSWRGDWGVDGWAWVGESYFGNGHDQAGLAAFAGVAIVSVRRDPQAPPIPDPVAA
ncbi:MAG: hypothetical protein JWO38_4865 [Gemmataceae bacterium]|nr:hypothetical protein [Gemmataceae bacterium]